MRWIGVFDFLAWIRKKSGGRRDEDLERGGVEEEFEVVDVVDGEFVVESRPRARRRTEGRYDGC